jgi:hypothetical protein
MRLVDCDNEGKRASAVIHVPPRAIQRDTIMYILNGRVEGVFAADAAEKLFRVRSRLMSEIVIDSASSPDTNPIPRDFKLTKRRYQGFCHARSARP